MISCTKLDNTLATFRLSDICTTGNNTCLINTNYIYGSKNDTLENVET